MSTIEAPSGGYRIAEVARRSGFTPATLRYYEKAGVLASPSRTASGYRVYDERALERLQLISRAKELGCTLEEITDLVEAWEADECGPVKHRLRSLVDAKVAEAQRRISEQLAFVAQLQATAANLAVQPVDGPCDVSCGCTTASSGTPASEGEVAGDGGGCRCFQNGTVAGPVASTAREPGGDTAPIACSLGGADMQGRLEEWQAVLAAVRQRRRLDSGVRLEFGPDAPLEEISRLATAEYDCCPFFGFALTIDGRGIALEVAAPADGQVLLEDVFGAATDDTTDDRTAHGRL